MTIQRLDWAHYLPQSTLQVQVRANSVTETLTVDVSSADDWYSAPSAATPSLADALATALLTHSEISAAAVSVNTSFQSRITFTPAAQILWTSSATTLPPEPFGYDGTADQGVSTSHTSTLEVAGTWRPGRPPSTDSRDRVMPVGGIRTTALGASRVSRFGLTKAFRGCVWTLVPRDRALTTFASSTAPFGAFEYAWLNSVSLGRNFRAYEQEDGTGYIGEYRLRALTEEALTRDAQYDFRWQVKLMMVRAD